MARAGEALVCCPHDDGDLPCCGMAVAKHGDTFKCPECGRSGVADLSDFAGRGSRVAES